MWTMLIVLLRSHIPRLCKQFPESKILTLSGSIKCKSHLSCNRSSWARWGPPGRKEGPVMEQAKLILVPVADKKLDIEQDPQRWTDAFAGRCMQLNFMSISFVDQSIDLALEHSSSKTLCPGRCRWGVKNTAFSYKWNTAQFD